MTLGYGLDANRGDLLSRFDPAAGLEQVAGRAFAATRSLVAAPAQQFQLHAPLELAARVRVFDRVDPVAKDAALAQIHATGAHFEARLVEADDGLNDAADVWNEPQLADAIEWANIGQAAIALEDMILTCGPDWESLVKRLAGPCIDTTAAAGHLPIFCTDLALLEAPFRGQAVGALPWIGSEIARPPALRFSALVEKARPAGSVDESLDALLGELTNIPHVGSAGFGIHPMVSKTLEAGVPGEALLDRLATVAQDRDASDTVFRHLLRQAAASMLVEPADHAFYGWSHCLTMPAAIWMLWRSFEADTLLALGAASAYFAGFRATAGKAALESDPLAAGAGDALEPGALATAAAIRTDAHLVKYVATVFQMAELDPAAANLYMRAASRLLALWREQVPDDAIGASLTDGRGG